jgi:transcriptional regulator with XRE-family HTH domain
MVIRYVGSEKREITMAREPVTKEAIAQRLRLAREQAGLSQGQVAKLLGLHRPSVTEAEAGRRRVTAEELVKLADLYGVSMSWLAGTEDDETSLHAAKAKLAARELQHLKPADLDRLLHILSALRRAAS